MEYIAGSIPQNKPKTSKLSSNEIDITCYQINNQKPILSCESITKYCEDKDYFICLGQEPSTYGERVTGLNSYHTIISAKVNRPRAYIYAHKKTQNVAHGESLYTGHSSCYA